VPTCFLHCYEFRLFLVVLLHLTQYRRVCDYDFRGSFSLFFSLYTSMVMTRSNTTHTLYTGTVAIFPRLLYIYVGR